MRTFIIAAVLALGFTSSAFAQQRADFFNPFATPAATRAARGATPAASVRYTYDVTRAEHGAGAANTQMSIEVASDWTLVREADREILYDFRLGRMFELHRTEHKFIAYNALWAPGFLLSEFANRAILAAMLARAGVQQGQLAGDCDAATELGVIPPGSALNAQLRDAMGVASVQCNGRNVGSVRLDGGAAPPPAFWPTVTLVMASYPLLLQHAKQSGHVPAQLETTFRLGGDNVTRRTFRLTATEAVATPYPLDDAYDNATAAKMDEFMTGMGTLAADAVAGRAAGGAPTPDSWNAHMIDVARRDGGAAAAMLVLPTFNMFPELATQCDAANAPALCGMFQAFRASVQTDVAVMGVLQVAQAEQQHDAPAVIAAMQHAQTSPNRNHPVLGAAYGLALSWFDQNAQQQARNAGLPTDPAPLEARALALLPYNPAYWTDVGDRFIQGYEWQKAMMFWDVAFSLPMATAVQQGPAMIDKRALAARIVHDAPDFFLQQ